MPMPSDKRVEEVWSRGYQGERWPGVHGNVVALGAANVLAFGV